MFCQVPINCNFYNSFRYKTVWQQPYNKMIEKYVKPVKR